MQNIEIKQEIKLWDLVTNGELYLNGFNSGDYSVHASLARYLNKRFGNIRLSFDNVNRSPSFIYNTASIFNFGNTATYKKENITAFKATADNPFITLGATDYFITNYNYFTNYYQTAQYSSVIDLLQLSASKKIKLSRHLNWYADIVVQQTDNASPIQVPLVFTRTRIAFEGTFYQNLNLSTGIEFRYYTPYKEYNYSPVMGQFFKQDPVTEHNLPDISVFMHFRLKTFTAYIRADNLNSVDFTNGLASPITILLHQIMHIQE
ncbi:MAG: putative porin [Ferruginibacter sp.]